MEQTLLSSDVMFFRNSDAKDNDEVQFTSTPLKETNKWGAVVLTFYVVHNGIAKKMSIKSAQERDLNNILGSNKVGWIGQKIKVHFRDWTNPEGKVCKALYFEKISK